MINRIFLLVSLSMITPTMSFSSEYNLLYTDEDAKKDRKEALENNTNQDQKESEYKPLHIGENVKENRKEAFRFYNDIIARLNRKEIEVGRCFFKSCISTDVVLQEICDNRDGYDLSFEKKDAEKEKTIKIETNVRVLRKQSRNKNVPKQYNVIFFNKLLKSLKKEEDKASDNFLIYKKVVDFLMTEANMQYKKESGRKNQSIICVATEKTPQEYFNSVVEKILNNMNNTIEIREKTLQESEGAQGKIIIKNFIDPLLSKQKKRDDRIGFYKKITDQLRTGKIKLGIPFPKSFISSEVVLTGICDNRDGHDLFFEINDREQNKTVKIKTNVRILKKEKGQYNVIFFNKLDKNLDNTSDDFLIYKNVVKFLLTCPVMEHKKSDGRKNFSIFCVVTQMTPQAYFSNVVEQVLKNMKNGTNETPQKGVKKISGKVIIKNIINEILNSGEKGRELNNENKVEKRKNKLTNESSYNNTQAKRLKNSSVRVSAQLQVPLYKFNFSPSEISQLSQTLNAPEKIQPLSNVIDLTNDVDHSEKKQPTFMELLDEPCFTKPIYPQNFIMNSNNCLMRDPLASPRQDIFPLLQTQIAPENLFPQNQQILNQEYQGILNQECQGMDHNDSEETLSDEK